MGNGIAHTFEKSGFSVQLIDIEEIALKKWLQNMSENLERMLQKGKTWV